MGGGMGGPGGFDMSSIMQMMGGTACQPHNSNFKKLAYTRNFVTADHPDFLRKPEATEDSENRENSHGMLSATCSATTCNRDNPEAKAQTMLCLGCMTLQIRKTLQTS